MKTATVPMQFEKQAWLDGARITARKLLRTRPFITIEDVLAEYPRPKFIHRNTTGQVFRGREFQPVGYTYSKRVVSNGRAIRYWTLSEEYSHGGDRDECN